MIERTILVFVFVGRHREHERLVDLDLVYGESLQVREGRVPVPKSSIETSMPSSATRSSNVTVRCGSAIIWVSVISRINWRGSRRARRTTSRAAPRGRRRAGARREVHRDREIEPDVGPGADLREREVEDERVIWRMSPVLSASSTNSSGGIGPCCGCCQRASASTPTIRPVPRSAFGW